MKNESKRQQSSNSEGLENLMIPGLNDEYFNQPVLFRDCDDHYELIYTGEFENVGRDSIAVTKLIQDLKDGNKDVELHILINSIGGSVDNLSFVLQQVLQYRHRVTVCCGSALSAGFILWACGHERYVSPYSELMYHTIYSGYEGKGNELASYGHHIERLNDELIKSVCMKDLISEQDMQKGKTTEVWYIGKDFIDAGKAKDYSEYANRLIPMSALVTVVSGCDGESRFFAKSGNNNTYRELLVCGDCEYEYQDILDLYKQMMNGDGKQETTTIEVHEESSSSSENDDEGDKKGKGRKQTKNKKKYKLSL